MCSALASAVRAQAPISGEEVENDGERVNPLQRDFNYGLHIGVYQFAAKRVKDKTVLDVGSGSGYGAYHLLEAGAEYVQGYEFSETAVQFSKENYSEAGLAYAQADFNQPVISSLKYDVVFSSNVFEHLTDVRQALANTVGLMKPDGEFILAIPSIIESPRLTIELGNPYHFANWSIKFWQRTMRRCFKDVRVYLQSMPFWIDEYNRLSEEEKRENKALSTFMELTSLGDIEFNDMSQIQYGYANLVFVCKNPTGIVELADFSECPVSCVRTLAWRNDPTTGWGPPLANGDSVSQDLPVRGWIGGIEFFLGDCCQRGKGTAVVELKVSPANGMPVMKQMTCELSALKESCGTPFQWSFYREPLFVPIDAILTMTIRSYAHGKGVFNVPYGTAYGQVKNPFLVRVYNLIHPIPQNTRAGVAGMK